MMGKHERRGDGETGRHGDGETGRQYLWQLANLVWADVQLLQRALMLEDIAGDDSEAAVAVVKHRCLVTNLHWLVPQATGAQEEAHGARQLNNNNDN